MFSPSPEFLDWGRWRRQTVVCIASGESLIQEDVNFVRNRAKVITVNTSFRVAPWADAHYSSDRDFWFSYIEEMRATCKGEFWSGDADLKGTDLYRCPFDKARRGLSTEPGILAWGGNSGYCAVGLAYQFGAARVVLLGYDMQGSTHWHGEHPAHIRKPFNFPFWLQEFEKLARDAKRVGLEIVNCSRATALDCFPKHTLQEVFTC